MSRLDTMGPVYALPDAVSAESPSLSFNSALARFEYEAGRAPSDATKVLMVEWEDDDKTRGTKGEWHISWKDRHSVLPAGDSNAHDPHAASPAPLAHNDIHRMFFLLPPDAPIPPAVRLVYEPADPAHASSAVQYKTQPLPAIFPPELGASAREAGKKGVLHTLWAKKRLAVLQAEIDAEYRNNFEGIGLAMALQEKEWIEVNFGVSAKRASAPGSLTIPTASDFAQAVPPSPASPRSPGGGRLLEKLRGLRVGTNEKEWAAAGIQTPPQTGGQANPLSPQTGDVAVSSFEAIKGASTARRPEQSHARRITAQAPPAELLAQQEQVTFGMAGLDSVAKGVKPPAARREADDDDDGLFALPMSPRSPDMAKSPFSFDATDVDKYRTEVASS